MIGALLGNPLLNVVVLGSLVAAICYVLRDRPAWVVATVPVVLVLVPPQAQSTYTIFFHPGVYIAAIFLAVQFFTDQRGVWEALVRSRWLVAAMVALSLYATLDLLNPHGIGSPIQLALTLARLFGAALVLFLAMRVGLRHGGRGMRIVVGALLLTGVLQVYLADQQVATDGESGYWWRSDYETSWWWVDSYALGIGTTGHPLQLGLFLASLVPMLVLVRRLWIRFALVLAFVYGISAATARTGLVLAIVGATYVVTKGVRRWGRTLILTAAAVPVVIALMGTKAVDQISGKFEADAGSAQLRGDARIWAWEHKDEFLYFGYPGARDLRGAGILGSSLENGYLMAGLEFGLVFAVGLGIFHLATTWLLFRRGGQWRIPLLLAVVFVLVGFNSSSSFMGGGLEASLFWVYLGMLAGDGDNAADEIDRTDEIGDETAPGDGTAAVDETESRLMTAGAPAARGYGHAG